MLVPYFIISISRTHIKNNPDNSLCLLSKLRSSFSTCIQSQILTLLSMSYLMYKMSTHEFTKCIFTANNVYITIKSGWKPKHITNKNTHWTLWLLSKLAPRSCIICTNRANVRGEQRPPELWPIYIMNFRAGTEPPYWKARRRRG